MRAAEKSGGVPARKSWFERRRDREENLRSGPRKLRQARQDFSAAVSIDPRPGARPAPGSVHPASHPGPRRRAARLGDRANCLDEFGEYRVGHFDAAIGQLDSPAIERQQTVVEQRRRDAAEDAFEVTAEALVKIGQREAVAQPQVQEYEFTLRGSRVDRFGAGLRNFAFFDRANVARWKFLIPPSPAAVSIARVTMSARSYSEVRLATPVGQIVARLVAGRRIVRNFVHRVAAPGNFLAHRLIHSGLLVGRERFDSSAL